MSVLPFSGERVARVAGLVMLGLGLCSGAQAEDLAYCAKMRARAEADAALLLSPLVQAQGIRFPQQTLEDRGDARGQEWQARLALGLSPLDMVRGKRVLDAADIDCVREQATQALAEALAHGPEQLRARALRHQLAALDEQADRARALLAQGEERFRAQVITLMELDELSAAHAAYERKRVEVRAAIARVDAEEVPPARHDLDELKSALLASTMDLEEQMVRIRALDPWRLNVRGGVVADAPLDWFGMVELTYNLGAVRHGSRDAAYLRERERELREARDELSHRADVLKRQQEATREQVAGERAIATEQLALLKRARSALEASHAPSAPHLISVLALRELVLDAELVYLTAFEEELTRS